MSYDVIRVCCALLRTDLVEHDTKFVAKACGQMAVADITYVRYRDGVLYLSLLTDSDSRYIIGWCLSLTLQTEDPLEALQMVEKELLET